MRDFGPLRIGRPPLDHLGEPADHLHFLGPGSPVRVLADRFAADVAIHIEPVAIGIEDMLARFPRHFGAHPRQHEIVDPDVSLGPR